MKNVYSFGSLIPCLLVSLCFTAFNYAQSFNASGLQGVNLVNPTSLDFGPNGKLYVSQQDGTLFEYTVSRDGADAGQGTYSIIDSKTINLIKTGVPNHNDDGTINTIQTRQVTGLLATGTAEIPVLYVSSSDSRIGGGPSKGDTNSDTNSGILSRLTWTGSAWDKVDLVRGLPRCEENHSTNGMDIFERGGNTYLLVQQGGNANKGAPSNNFGGTSETYLSASMLIINLTQLEQMEAANGGPYVDTRQGTTQYIYDLPTLNDPDRADITNVSPNFPYKAGHPLFNATIDVGDPFGGNNSLNQAFAEPGGPVQIFSPGFRNAYDVLVTTDGKIYSSDNGPNTGWGGPPIVYDSGNNPKIDQTIGSFNALAGDYIVNDFNEGNSSAHGDALHYVGTINDPNGTYYGGHPVPTRAFPSRAGVKAYTYETQGTNAQWVKTSDFNFGDLLPGASGYFQSSFNISDFSDDPRQGEYLANSENDPRMHILDVVGFSTNGICEYTASNFDGAMQGDILTASYANNGYINRYQLDVSGTGLVGKNNNFLAGFGSQPLDVIAQGDADPFPGTIWAATYGAKNITVFEPADFAGCIQPNDPGYVGTDDYDSDGYTNDDEVANDTDICSGGSQPSDNDGDKISDLTDPDDDNDGIPDVMDAFALDADNGTTTDLPIVYPFWNNDPGTGLYGLGFTGLMLDPSGNTDYLDQFDADNLTFGGAGGVATIDAVSEGDARGITNTQENAFQVGINVDSNSDPFTAHSKIESPFANVTPVTGLSIGMYIGSGNQDSYLKVAITEGTNNTDDIYGFEVLTEDGPQNISSQTYDVPGVLNGTGVDVYINVNPAANTAQPYYSIDGGETVIALGSPVTLPTSFLNPNDNQGLAVGLIATSAGIGPEFTATWDFLNIIGDGAAQLALSENPVDFGNLAPGSGQVQLVPSLTNEGGPSAGAVEVTAINITGADAGLFESTTTLPLTIGPGSSKTLPLKFNPNTVEGNKNASLEILHTGANSPYVVPLNAVLGEGPGVSNVIARINAGGTLVNATDGKKNWEANLGNGPVNGTDYSVNTGTIPAFTNEFLYANRHSSIPAYIDEGTFNALFTKERYDSSGGEEMEFKIPLPNGDYLVNIYTGNAYAPANGVGDRIFDILLEGELKGDNLDVVELFGNGTDTEFHAGMVSYNVTVADGELNVLFNHAGAENPVLQALEVLGAGADNGQFTVLPIADQFNQVGDMSELAVGANGGNPQANFTYAISGQPDGIGIEPTNGQIFGTITQQALQGGANNDGVHNVVVEVSQPGSQTATIEFTWTIANLVWTNKDEAENYTARHECSFVQAGDKFYLMGGRENAQTIDVYDYTTNTWTQIPESPPVEFNHFQATEYKGLIWVIGAFKTNAYPNEEPSEYVWAFDPVKTEWIQGPEIPVNRRRGSAGVVIHDNKFYISGGNIMGHNGGYVPYLDEYDPSTGVWTPLADAPRARDHFHAGVIGDKMYLAGGRLSGGDEGVFKPTIAEIDVYDFTTDTWSTLPAAQNIPTPRGGATTVNFRNKLIVIGGEVENQQVYGETVDDALKITEQYDPVAQQWTRLSDLNNERHGTQAIVSGNGVFITAGSPQRGGANQKNMEFLGLDAPVGSPSAASTLTAPEEVPVGVGSSQEFNLDVSGGNVGIIIRTMEITGADAANFSITEGALENALLGGQDSRPVTIALNGDGEGSEAVLTINYGADSSLDIVLRSGVTALTVTTPATQSNAEGDDISLQIEATGTSDGTMYSATGLPPTLAIDAVTGLITGTIAAGASADSPYQVTVSVTNATAPDNPITAEFSWVVGDATGPGGNPSVADNVLVLYPNPASTQITLGFANDVVLKVIRIFDRGGRLTKEVIPNVAPSDGQYIIDVSMLADGLYFVHSVDNTGKKFTKQMVIKR